MKNRKQKAEDYQKKYGDIPIDYTERLNYLIDKYNLSDKPGKMEEILQRRWNMMQK